MGVIKGAFGAFTHLEVSSNISANLPNPLLFLNVILWKGVET
jgi:hypothetical protein